MIRGGIGGNLMFISLFIMATNGTHAATTKVNPLAMAEKGNVQCYRPDVQNKTCQSIASYRRTAPGTYDNKALIPLSPNTTLEMHTPVVLKAGAVCGFVRGRDVLAGTLRVGGTILRPDKANPILERVAQALAPMADKEICTRYEPLGEDFIAKVSIAGAYQHDEDKIVKWISLAEGFTVTP
jgi:hypothetical protein